jgi:DNA-directed RNA polymerase, mitochondrial
VAERRGIHYFAMIHDSYGTHAADTEALANCTRASFMVFYQNDVLGDFKREVEARLPDGVELPPMPDYGTLDLTEILRSDYFFA